MRIPLTCLAILGASMAGPATPRADAQTATKKTSTAGSHRTLTGKVGEVKAGDGMVSVEIAGEAMAKKKKAADAPTWILSVSPQTMLLRAGKNSQFATIELSEVKAGDMVQAVAVLQADPADKSHTAWWLVVYPEGTKPPEK